jgi:hypothetical protein
MPSIRETFDSVIANSCLERWWDCPSAYADEDPPKPKVIQYEIEGEGGGTWHVVIGTAKPHGSKPDPLCVVREGSVEAPDLRLTMPDADWLEVVTGRSSIWQLLASGRVKAEGDRTLIGDLNILGLIGAPVTPKEIATCERPHWVGGSVSLRFVLPRVLTAGRLDHNKWRYFVERGDLIVTPVSPVPWHALKEPLAARYAETLRPVLEKVQSCDRWFHIMLPTLWLSLPLISLLVLMIVGWYGYWSLFVLLLVFFVFLFVVVGLGTLNSLPITARVRRRASEVLIRLACDDVDFFRFALERRLMQIAPKDDF